MRTIEEGSHIENPDEAVRAPRPAPTRLRSRAEQIEDELAAGNHASEPTVRRLPTDEPPPKPSLPGR